MKACSSLRLLGHMASCTYIVQYTRLQLRHGWLWCTHQTTTIWTRSSWFLPKFSLPSVSRWIHWQFGWAFHSYSPIHHGPSLQTRAGELTLRTRGLWSTEELSLHINIRELREVHPACQAFWPQVASKNVLVHKQHDGDVLYQ